MSFKQFLVEDLILNSPMNEMANLYPQKTGFELVIWFGEVGGQHGPRIKVSNVPGKFRQDNCFVISVTKDPEVLTPMTMKITSSKVNEIKSWIVLNYDVLMKMWLLHETGDGDLDILLNSLKRI